MHKKRDLIPLILLIFLSFCLIACQTPAGRSTGQVIDDAAITTKVKAKLFDESILRGFSISVDTFKGEVTLTGAVDSDSQRKRAEKIARSVTGVRGVNNLLSLK